MPNLPTFTADSRVTAETGREDKIEVMLGRWVLQGSRQTLDELRDSIASPPETVRAQLSEDDLGDFGWIFDRPQNHGQRRKPLRIRQRDLRNASGEVIARTPLFAGKWMFKYSAAGSDVMLVPTDLALSLNPLRFVRNNPGPRPFPAPDADNWPAARLTKRDGGPQQYGEFSLDGEDNWLPDTSYHAAWADAERWKRHLLCYLRGVGVAFRSELDRAATMYDAHVSFQEHFRLNTVETAWEFTTAEPIQLVRDLAPHLHAYNDLSAQTAHYRATIEERIVNSPSIMITPAANVSLRVYAKTNRRVRFEIIHRRINVRELLGEPPSSPHHAPVRPWSQILDCLSALRARAAAQLNVVLEFLSQRARHDPPQMSGFSLLIGIASAVGSATLANTVVSLLLDPMGGAIRARRTAPELLTACQRLSDAGILAYNATRRVYDVTPSYSYGLAMLRTLSEGRIVTRARRRTRSAQN